MPDDGTTYETWADPRDVRPVAARIDLHCHSAFSKDSLGTLDAIAAAARGKGLDGVCLTDHDTVRHHGAIEDWNRTHGDGFRFWPGCEVSTNTGHMLAIGIREAVPYGLPVEETIDEIIAAGGMAVPSHPLRRGSGVRMDGLDRHGTIIRAVEVWNAQEPERRNQEVADWARTNRVGGTGGSDAHQVHDTGNGYTLFPDNVDLLDDLLDQLAGGDTWGVGTKTARTTLVRQAARNTLRRLTRRL
ncbi:MAG: CehA/McbA family metallohydrolase [Euryarchaeota archaeon]|nr:CehA/McbA family metallohydrolase [Euryarchaeota archaeon]